MISDEWNYLKIYEKLFTETNENNGVELKSFGQLFFKKCPLYRWLNSQWTSKMEYFVNT